MNKATNKLYLYKKLNPKKSEKMKRLLFMLLVLSFVTGISAQEIYVKRTSGKDFYRVTYINGYTRYATLSHSVEPTLKNLKDSDASISRKTYLKVDAEEELVSSTPAHTDSPSMDASLSPFRPETSANVDAVLDAKRILAKPIPYRTIASYVPYQPGENYELLRVTSAADSSLVGCNIVCQILDRRKSNIGGSEGRISLLPLFINTPNGKLPLSPTSIHRRGLNRVNAKFWTSIFVIPIFIPGTRAQLLPTETVFLRLE